MSPWVRAQFWTVALGAAAEAALVGFGRVPQEALGAALALGTADASPELGVAVLALGEDNPCRSDLSIPLE